MKIIRKLLISSRGATAMEYVLIATLLCVALIGGYKTIGNSYKHIYNNISDSLPG
ncbi:MAG: Flp family type IVb pilin [Holosporaceae bacterium]|jgi:pilus assembly protein Flp/PilA|nr:Flp family type IVb pilin [Holosporaceae bacterium]